MAIFVPDPTEEGHVPRVPGARGPGAEVAPARVVRQQLPTVQLLGEQVGEIGPRPLVRRAGRLGHVELVEAGGRPGLGVGLDDEGRDVGRDRVGVHGEVPVLAAAVEEGEPVEHVVRAEPDELGGRLVHGMAQSGLADLRPQPRVGAIRSHHDVVLAEVGETADLGGEAQVDARAGRLLLKKPQQGLAVDRRHPVATEAPDLALGDDVDRVPVRAVLA
jgi:hypothetical protein